jgi:hypothetical protein
VTQVYIPHEFKFNFSGRTASFSSSSSSSSSSCRLQLHTMHNIQSPTQLTQSSSAPARPCA